MIVKTNLSVINRVYAAVIEVELDGQETRYVKAYSEPTISVGGEIPFDSGVVEPPQDLVFSVEEDVGPPSVGGIATFNSASSNWEITAAGETNALLASVSGFHKGYENVVGDVVLETQIDFIDQLPDQGDAENYLVGFCVLPGTDAGSDLAGMFFGWGEYNGLRRIWAFDKGKAEDGTVLGTPVVLASPNGVFLRMTRTGNVYGLFYSLNNGQTWSQLGEWTHSSVAPRLGFFVSSGDNDATVTALFSKIRSQRLPAPPDDTFTVLGASDRLIRSQSPHTFRLDGKVDPLAQNKVQGWADEIELRLEAAKVELLANPDPGMNPTTTTSQV